MRHQWKHKVDMLESTIEGTNDDEVTFVKTVMLCHWKGTIKGITNSDLTSKKNYWKGSTKGMKKQCQHYWIIRGLCGSKNNYPKRDVVSKDIVTTLQHKKTFPNINTKNCIYSYPTLHRTNYRNLINICNYQLGFPWKVNTSNTLI